MSATPDPEAIKAAMDRAWVEIEKQPFWEKARPDIEAQAAKLLDRKAVER